MTEVTEVTPAPSGAPRVACANGCRWHAARGPLFAAIGWLTAAVAVLALAAIPGDYGEHCAGFGAACLHYQR